MLIVYVFVFSKEITVGEYLIVVLFVMSWLSAYTIGLNSVFVLTFPFCPFMQIVLGITGQPPRFQDYFQYYHHYLEVKVLNLK